ncbi:MAG: VTT domain-containing protein [Mycobacteriaceae bacterium]
MRRAGLRAQLGSRELRWRIAGIAVLLALGCWLVVAVGVPDLDWLRAQVAVLGFWAGPVFAGFYALITPTPLPKTVLTLGAGAVFGVGYGLVVVLAGATAGAVLTFYLARMLGREVVLRSFGTAVGRVDAQARRYGVWAVLLLRLVPVVPFTALNWVAGVTAVRIRDFVLATPVGMLPTTTATIVVGAYGTRGGSWPFLLALGALLLLTAGAAIVHRRRPPDNRK